jgi:hypothetical protein
VTSPSEPGAPKQGDSLKGDASAERAAAHRAASAPSGRGQDTAEPPPWQRGASRASQSTQRETESYRRETDAHSEKRSPVPPAGADARLNRFVSGTGGSAHTKNPTQELDAVPARNDGPHGEAYASELPDLSGPGPRPPQRKAASDRGPETPKSAGPSRSGTEGIREGRDSRDDRVQVSRRTRGPVRASMQIRRIDPWSTLKVSLLLSVALFFVWMIAVAFLYLVLGGMGVWAKLNSNVGDLLNNTSGSSTELVSSGTIFGGAIMIGLVNIVLLTAMATIGVFIYNLTTDLIGGIEVTLADRD